MAFNAYNSVPMILEAFKGYEVRTSIEDNETLYLHFIDPLRDGDATLQLGIMDEDEYIVFFDQTHTHYRLYEWGTAEERYQDMLKLMHSLLENRACCASISHYTDDGELQWLGGSMLDASELGKPITELFSYIYVIDEFAAKLHHHGGIVQYRFWDPALDRDIVLEKVEGV